MNDFDYGNPEGDESPTAFILIIMCLCALGVFIAVIS
jgi:hypothetical protein